MSGKSNIEWTEQTWNPVVGCSIVSPGCTNCYAMKMAARIETMRSSHYDGATKKVNGNAVWTGKLALAPESTLMAPLRLKTPTTYFVNSMGDLFHEDCPDEWMDRVFAVMALCPQHTFQVLTKRPDRMRDYFATWPMKQVPDRITEKAADIAHKYRRGWQGNAGVIERPLPNVWLGVSCERQEEADERIPLLLQTPAAVRFISAEPLLGPIDLNAIPLVQPFNSIWWDTKTRGGKPPQFNGLDWIIIGGESGPRARPMQIEWADSIVAQCRNAGVACFVKQLGAAPLSDGYPLYLRSSKGGDPDEWPESLRVREFPTQTKGQIA
jgi:protein gp37